MKISYLASTDATEVFLLGCGISGGGDSSFTKRYKALKLSFSSSSLKSSNSSSVPLSVSAILPAVLPRAEKNCNSTRAQNVKF